MVAFLLLALAACDGGSDSTTASSTTISSTTTTQRTTTTVPLTTTSGPPATTTTSTTTTTVPDFDLVEVDLTAGEDPGRVTVELGRTVRLVVTADTTDEVHLHGYDIKADVAPGVPAVLEFVADIPGIFDVELEAAGDEFMQFQVEP